MDIFREDGHLREWVFAALVNDKPLDELQRLEISEHLAYCDLCLQQYTDVLSGAELLTPLQSCRESVWRRIRMRTLQLLTSRYATAAAAVTLALTVVWGSRGFEAPVHREDAPSWTKEWSDSLDGTMAKFNAFLDGLEPPNRYEEE